MNRLILLLLTLVFIFSACSDDDNETKEATITSQYRGLVFEEGVGRASDNFQINFYSDNTYTLYTNIQHNYGPQGSAYLFSSKGSFTKSGTTVILSEKAEITILDRKYPSGAEQSESTTGKLSEWFPIEYTQNYSKLVSKDTNESNFSVEAQKE